MTLSKNVIDGLTFILLKIHF